MPLVIPHHPTTHAMLNLYDYQENLISSSRNLMSQGHRQFIVQAPTGAGKTVIFSYIVSQMKSNGLRALILTDRVELLFETGGTLEEFDIKPYHILAGQMVQPPMDYQVYVAMSQTLRRRIDNQRWKKFWNSFDVVIVDECHKQEFNPYFEQKAFTNNPFILGFSATPIRSGKQRQLGSDYSSLIEGPQVPELIKRNYLVKDRYFPVKSVDMKGVRLNSFGDYQESGMFEKFNKPALYSGVIDNWIKHTPDTITLCFCVNIQHTIETCKAFNNAGIKAKFITSNVSKPKLPDNPTEAQVVRYNIKKEEYDNYQDAMRLYSGERDQVLKEWKRGDFKVLINAGILTTGFNYKPIETIIMNRATTSVALWLQILGRGSRTFPGKTHFNVLDFGANGERLGYYNQMRSWGLMHEEKQSGGAIPVKECGQIKQKAKIDKNGKPGCGALIFTSLMICPYCGYVFEQEKKEKFAWLEEFDYTKELNTREDVVTVNGKEIDFANLERTQEERGYKPNWIIVQIILSGGEDGLKMYAEWKRKKDPEKYGNGWFWMTKKRYSGMILKYNQQHSQV